MRYEFLVPSALSLTVKIGMFFSSDIKKADRGVIAFLIGAICLNIIEALTFTLPSFESAHNVWFIRFYYAGSFLCIGGSLYTVELLLANRVKVLYGIYLFVSYGILMSVNPLTISGFTDIGYSMKSEAGPFYLLLVIPMFLSLLALVGMLSMATRLEGMNGLKAKVLAAGLAPVIAVALVVIIALQFGMKANATLFMSFALLIYAAVMIKNETIVHFYTSNRAKINQVDLVDLALTEGQEAALEELRYMSLVAALKYTNDNKTGAAELLDVSKSTLYRQMKIKPRRFKDTYEIEEKPSET